MLLYTATQPLDCFHGPCGSHSSAHSRHPSTILLCLARKMKLAPQYPQYGERFRIQFLDTWFPAIVGRERGREGEIDIVEDGFSYKFERLPFGACRNLKVLINRPP